MHRREDKITRIHAIGYGHLDPIWLWDWREGFREALATFRTAVLKLKAFPDLKISFSSAAIFRWAQQYDPDLFDEIKTLVRQNQLEVVGGWWIESDLNLPSGESLIRQGFYGKRFFKEVLGIDCLIGFNPDSFGHPVTLPKILKQLGQFYYVFMRPDPNEKQLPQDVFIWQGDDGSQILTARIPDGYGCEVDCDRKVARLAHYLQQQSVVQDALCFFGVGDHGGGPTQQAIETLRQSMQAAPELRLQFSTLLNYFMHLETCRAQLPLLPDELQHHARGCYSVHADLKRLNRRSEQQLLGTEKWGAIAFQILKREIPENALEHAWKNILFHQFHDVITGTSIRPALQEARQSFHETLAITDRELFGALRAIANQVRITDENGEFIVFNPVPWSRLAPIELEYAYPFSAPMDLVDANGNNVPCQEIQRSDLTPAARKRWHFWDILPPLGYKTYRWEQKSDAHRLLPADSDLKIGETWLENQFWRLEFDPQGGQLIRFYDRRREIELLQAPAAIARILEDPSDTWSHGVNQFSNRAGQFGAPECRIYEAGPLRCTLVLKLHFNHSTFEQRWTLYRDEPRIAVHLKIDWHEQQRMLKYCFPLALRNPMCRCDQPYGDVQRPPDGNEQPFQTWLSVQGTANTNQPQPQPYGIAFLNDGLYAYSLDASELQLTLCRSAIYAHHDPSVPAADEIYEYTDQGRHEIKLWIVPFPGPRIPAEIIRLAHELNAPPMVLVDYPHSGYLPKSNAFLEISAPNVIVTVFKKATDSDEFILRGYETAGLETTAQINLPYWKLSGEFTLKPFELKTFRLKIKASRLELWDSNALEE